MTELSILTDAQRALELDERQVEELTDLVIARQMEAQFPESTRSGGLALGEVLDLLISDIGADPTIAEAGALDFIIEQELGKKLAKPHNVLAAKAATFANRVGARYLVLDDIEDSLKVQVATPNSTLTYLIGIGDKITVKITTSRDGIDYCKHYYGRALLTFETERTLFGALLNLLGREKGQQKHVKTEVDIHQCYKPPEFKGRNLSCYEFLGYLAGEQRESPTEASSTEIRAAYDNLITALDLGIAQLRQSISLI